MRKFLPSVILVSALAIPSSLALASMPHNENQQIISSAKSALQISQQHTQVDSQQKYCRVVRNSLYGKFRKKCRTATEWEKWIAKHAPKINKQWQVAGATSGVKHGKILNSNMYIATDPLVR